LKIFFKNSIFINFDLNHSLISDNAGVGKLLRPWAAQTYIYDVSQGACINRVVSYFSHFLCLRRYYYVIFYVIKLIHTLEIITQSSILAFYSLFTVLLQVVKHTSLSIFTL